mgnify:CR=1 FL=1
MADSWYYVSKGQRLGPVDVDVVAGLVQKGELGPDDYVWKKGFENWCRVQEVEDLQRAPSPQSPAAPPPNLAGAPKSEGAPSGLPRLGSLGDDKCAYVRIGADRGGAPAEYGPYNIALLRRLYEENRINARTQVFIKEKMREWTFLADLPDFEEVFHDVPPVIQEIERRKHVRKPLVARLFVQNNKKVFEGVCRDISVGGMQVLTDGFPGKAGDRISINVHPDSNDHHFTAAGQVVRLLEGGQGFSFRFDGLNQEALRAIETYIANVDQNH